MVAEKISTTKRKTSNLNDSRAPASKKRKTSNNSEQNVYKSDNIFCLMMDKAGFHLKTGKIQNEISCDQAVLQRSLQLALKRHADYPKVVDDFVDGMQEYIEDQSRFYYTLLPTTTVSDCTSARSSCQDCLVRILLGINLVQPKLMTCLLEKLAEFMGEEDSVFEHGEKVNLPRLLMSQFRWIDSIVNGKEVTDKMLEMVGIVSLDVQREIITCLPEVVEDSEHGYIATALRDMLLQNKDLTVPILDALSNLTLKEDLLSEIRGSVLQTLASVEMEDLPVVIKFILQSLTSIDALEIVTEIRANLEFNTSFPPTRSSTPHNRHDRRGLQKSGDVQRGAEALTLDAIKSGIRFQKSVAESWIKAIDAVKLPGDHKEMDIFICLILHSTNRKKPVESLFRNKIRSGAFTEVLLQGVFGAHAEVLRDYFPSVLSLSEVLLRSVEPAITYFASAMYKHAFVSFDSFCQQEIVGNLVTHIGSGFDQEVDSSLDILTELVEKHLTKMAPFAIFVKGILDYIENLTVTQIRKLYSMLSLLAFRNPQDGGLIQDDLHIIIRKQLSNDNPKYKRMGIIGAIMVVKSIAYNSSIDMQTSQVSTQPLTDCMFKQVINLLQLVMSSSTRMSEVSALFMDELSAVVEKDHLDPKIEEWITENMTNEFQDDYIVDLEDGIQDSLIANEVKFGLDNENGGSISVPLISLTEKSYLDKRSKKSKFNTTKKKVDPVCLAPHFRLLKMCELAQSGNLENIDALLGCPLTLAKDEVIEKFDSLSTKEKDIVCGSLFHALNWFREIVNAFATLTDTEMKAKVITRLQNITELEETLEKCLAVHATFIPSPATFDCYDCLVKPVATTVQDGKKKGKKPTKKKKSDKQMIADEDGDQARDTTVLDKTVMTQTQGPENTDSSDKACIDINSYRPFFRELDIGVFVILNTGMITKSTLDTEMNTKTTTELSIQPKQLEFLLEDLNRKMTHSLIASTSKRLCFLKTKSDKNFGFGHLDQLAPVAVATKTVKLLSALCDHLERSSGFFQTMIADNDGLIDGPGSSSPESQLMASCFYLLLQSLLTLFSWNGFLMAENKSLLKEGFEIMVARIKPAGATQVGFQELVKYSFQYIENFTGTVPNLRTAVVLVRLLSIMKEKSDSDLFTDKIAKVCEEILKREWLGPDGEREKGTKHHENLQIILKMYLTNTDDVLVAAESIATKGISELLDTDKNGYSSTYPTLTKNSFAIYYKTIFIELISCIKDLAQCKQSDSKEVRLDKLLRWNQAVRILHILINLIKAFDGRSNLGAALKYGRQFVEIFLRLGMPLLDQMFRNYRDDVQGLLKNLQLSTRNLHHMCGHSKIMKDVALTNQVPQLKKCLEAFVYRVKAMLTVNKCLEAFWLGNLKNKDLKGEEILSQSTTASDDTSSVGGGDDDDDDDDDEGNLEEDDEESDVEMDNQSEAGDDKSRDGSNSDDDSRSIQY